MKKGSFLLMMVLIVFLMGSCATSHFVVGSGAKGSKKIEHTQFYLLWSLIPFNFCGNNGYVDTIEMAGAETDHYEIKTYTSFVNGFTYLVTLGILGSKTVVVIK